MSAGFEKRAGRGKGTQQKQQQRQEGHLHTIFNQRQEKDRWFEVKSIAASRGGKRTLKIKKEKLKGLRVGEIKVKTTEKRETKGTFFRASLHVNLSFYFVISFCSF